MGQETEDNEVGSIQKCLKILTVGYRCLHSGLIQRNYQIRKDMEALKILEDLIILIRKQMTC